MFRILTLKKDGVEVPDEPQGSGGRGRHFAGIPRTNITLSEEEVLPNTQQHDAVGGRVPPLPREQEEE